MGEKQTYYVDYVLYRNKKMKINVTINWNNYYTEVTNRLFFIARKFIKEKLLIHNIQRNEKKMKMNKKIKTKTIIEKKINRNKKKKNNKKTVSNRTLPKNT
jgi:hypothetical protein